ncbi:MAG TPA: AI-2E family transporter [Thauera sp.]|nr:AI-2E family transporter [Thauera sp.]
MTATVLVVVVITYVSIVVGELVPKRIGLINPEGIAGLVARPMNVLAIASGTYIVFVIDEYGEVQGMGPLHDVIESATGVGLLLCGALVVSWVDNLIRPLVISEAAQIPFLLVMFGVLGGLAAFGLVDLFLGPVVLAVLMAVWQEWIEESDLAKRNRPSSTSPN